MSIVENVLGDITDAMTALTRLNGGLGYSKITEVVLVDDFGVSYMLNYDFEDTSWSLST